MNGKVLVTGELDIGFTITMHGGKVLYDLQEFGLAPYVMNLNECVNSIRLLVLLECNSF